MPEGLTKLFSSYSDLEGTNPPLSLSTFKAPIAKHCVAYIIYIYSAFLSFCSLEL